MRKLGERIRQKGHTYEERILRNYTSIPTITQLFRQHFELPWSHDQIMDWAEQEITALSHQVMKSDELMKFWNILASMIMDGLMRFGRHYQVDQLKSVTLIGNEVKHFENPKNILYLHLPSAQQLYSRQCKMIGERPMDSVSLENYLKDKEYCLGRKNVEYREESQRDAHGGKRLKRRVLKSWVIDLDAANLTDTAFCTERDYEAAVQTSDKTFEEEKAEVKDPQDEELF
jgi:hypothetical protein